MKRKREDGEQEDTREERLWQRLCDETVSPTRFSPQQASVPMDFELEDMLGLAGISDMTEEMIRSFGPEGDARCDERETPTLDGAREFDFDEFKSLLGSQDKCGALQLLQTHLHDSRLSADTKENIREMVLPWICVNAEGGSGAEIAKEVLATSRNLHRLVNELPDGQEMLPLHFASRYGQVEIVKLLLEAKADVNAVDEEARTPLFWASNDGQTSITRLLLQANANVDLGTKNGRTPLLHASWLGYTEFVVLLLEVEADVDTAETTTGDTPLMLASAQGRSKIVELLLEAGADWNARDLSGATALHFASTVKVAKLLLEAGASLDVLDEDGMTPLHRACMIWSPRLISFFFSSSSNLNVPDRLDRLPLHIALCETWLFSWREHMQSTFQTLVEVGCEWDALCDEMVDRSVSFELREKLPDEVANERWKVEAPAIRLCFKRWMQEHQQGLPFTDVPVEQVRNGEFATNTYITEMASSREVVFRHKVSVVGPSNWGKTSLIKTLIAQEPVLVDSIDRTIGIDQLLWRFEQQLGDLKATKKHEVTFWDFAGQDAYQVAHSLFFSARTLYVVCVDLQSYVTAQMQATMMTDTESEADNLLNEFIDTRVLRWVRMICARQNDAHFVFVATKKDLLLDIDLTGDRDALADLQKRLDNVEVIVREMKKHCRESRLRDKPWTSADDLPITHMNDKRLADMPEKPRALFIATSTKNSADIEDFKIKMRGVIENSERGFAMPDKFALVLARIEGLKKTAASLEIDKRLDCSIIDVEKLITSFVQEIVKPNGSTEEEHRPTAQVEVSEDGISTSSSTIRKHDFDDTKLDFPSEGESSSGSDNDASEEDDEDSEGDEEEADDEDRGGDEGELDDEEPYLDAPTCRVILETLRDLGDVLWYDNVGDAMLKNKIIVHPMLMIDLVREVFNHKHTAEVMTHETLQGLALWKYLKGTPGMLSMKRVLQYFYLAYPTTKEMQADSDLIVPAYWQSNTCALKMFGGGDVRFGPGVDREDVAVRVHWEYHFVNNYPDTLFDHLVVASYSPYYERVVGPDWLMYMETDKVACRVMLGRDVRTHHSILHLEALQSHEVDADNVVNLWECFTMYLTAIEKVIRTYPGVNVFRCARVDSEKDAKEAKSLSTLKQHAIAGPARKWMPPQDTWATYVEAWEQTEASTRG